MNDTLTIDHNNGRKSVYTLIPDGQDLPIAYHLETPNELIKLLEHHRKNRTRLRFHWGDGKTGKDWGDTYGVSGHIGLSRGYKARFPILIHNTRSMGGTGISTNCIVKITTTAGKKPIYTHPTYHL